MKHDHPNCPYPLDELHPHQRFLEPERNGIAHDGYRLIARSPRIRGTHYNETHNQSMHPDKAGMLERIFSPFSPDANYDSYDE